MGNVTNDIIQNVGTIISEVKESTDSVKGIADSVSGIGEALGSGDTASAVQAVNAVTQTTSDATQNVKFSLIQNNLATSKLLAWFMDLLLLLVVIGYLVAKLKYNLDLIDLVKTICGGSLGVNAYYYGKAGFENVKGNN